MNKREEESLVERLTRERDEWHKAWHDQREATGRAYWQGYNQAITVMARFLTAFPYTTKR